MIKTYDQTNSVKGLPPIRKDKQKNDFYVNGIYEIKPLNFKKYTKCRILNVLKRTVAVEILETHNDHDKNLAIELQGRTVALNKHVGRVIEIGADAYKKSFGEETKIELKNTKKAGLKPIAIFMVDVKGNVKKFDSIRDAQKETGISTTVISQSCKKKRRLTRGKRMGYQFLFADIDKEEMERIIQENLKTAPKPKRNRKPVFVDFPNGTTKHFDSAHDAAEKMKTNISFIYNAINLKRTITKGKLEGVRIYYKGDK